MKQTSNEIIYISGARLDIYLMEIIFLSLSLSLSLFRYNRFCKVGRRVMFCPELTTWPELSAPHGLVRMRIFLGWLRLGWLKIR